MEVNIRTTKEVFQRFPNILLLGSILGIGIATVLLTLIIFGRNTDVLESDLPEQEVREHDYLFTLRPEMLMLPDIPAELWRGFYQPLERPIKQWGMDELAKYLYDPLILASENIRGANQILVKEILEQYR